MLGFLAHPQHDRIRPTRPFIPAIPSSPTAPRAFRSPQPPVSRYTNLRITSDAHPLFRIRPSGATPTWTRRYVAR